MSSAHLHKLQLLQLCKGHSGAISVMNTLQQQYQLTGDYYKCCNYLQKYNIYGEALYTLWNVDCQKDYERFLKYYF
jgi:hypothetical protein